MSNINVAIDGPAGAGKSTIAKAVAKKMGFVYIDTGAMYRSVALFAINQEIDIKNNQKDLIFCLKHIKIDLVHTNEGQRVILNGEDVTERIRREDVSMAASAVAVIPEVRLMLVELQRKIASGKNVIMDGRDIGTYVLPNADLKIFLTASIAERAKRRWKENLGKGISCDLETIEAEIAARDKNDSQRAFAPLRQAEDAVYVDTSDMGLKEAQEAVCQLVRKITAQKRRV